MALRRPNLNFKDGTGTTAVTADNPALNAVDVTINATVSHRELLITWTGKAPTTTGPGLEVFVPTFAGICDLASAKSRLNVLPSGSCQFRIEKSAGGAGFSGSPTTVTTLTHTTSDWEKTAVGLTGTVVAGDLLRIYFAAMSPSGGTYQVQLRATEE